MKVNWLIVGASFSASVILARCAKFVVDVSKDNKKENEVESSINVEVDDSSPMRCYFEEVEVVRATIPKKSLASFEKDIGILEAFMCHCKSEHCEDLLKSIILALTIRSCMCNLNNEFPKTMLPFVLEEAKSVLYRVITESSPSNELEKIALPAVEELFSILQEEEIIHRREVK